MYQYDGIDYNSLIKKHELVLVDFFAEWCGPCRKLMPILENIAKIKSNIFIIKVNVDNYKELVLNNKIISFPTLILYKNGKELKRKIGYCEQDHLLKFLEY